jgi:translation initiation factor 2 beta subunit (eIF-2beta)/eIF-5
MFNIVKSVFSFNDSLYILKRTFKETSMPEELVQDYKKYIGADAVLKKDGIYYFVNKIEEAQIVEETHLQLELPLEF